MFTIDFLQSYWWVLISVLGAALVFMLFVQGGQSMLLQRLGAHERTEMITTLGHKWELTFTTLVVFGGAFFASFPLFYSTSFGGAYWLWMLILFSFILQAVSYEFRSKPGNIYGSRTYDIFLFINGCVGCILLGVAVAMFFFGAEFTVNFSNILDAGSPVISRWAPTHGFEAIFNWKNLVLGVAVLFLARTMAALYFINDPHCGSGVKRLGRTQTMVNGAVFVLFFLIFLFLLLTASGLEYVGKHEFVEVPFKYLHNFLEMWWVAVIFLIGVVMVLYAILRTSFCRSFTKGVWWCGIGSVLVVMCLFWIAGFNATAYYPSLLDPEGSLTIANSSSTPFTLEVMTWVSVITPFVLAYIIYVWRAMTK